MKPVNIEEITRLHQLQDSNLVSIYLPTHSSGIEVQNLEDARVLKNNVHQVRRKLEQKGFSEQEAYQYLEPIYQLTDDNGFWRHQSEGLALFLTEKEKLAIHKLPFKVENFHYLGDRLYLKPLIQGLNNDTTYYIVALSLDKIRFLEANELGVHEINLEEALPEGIEEILSYYDFQQSLQMRSQESGPTTGDDVHYHGHGSGKKDNTPYIEEYFRKVNEQLKSLITSNSNRAVLAGVDYLHPIYKDVNTIFELTEDGIQGNPNALKPSELHAEANKIMQPIFKQQLRQRIEKYQQLAGSGKTSYNLEEIVKAAVNGRIEALFLTKTSHRWGKLDINGEPKVEIHEDYRENDQDLFDISAVKTVLNSGETYFVDKDAIPEKTVETEIAAVFRY